MAPMPDVDVTKTRILVLEGNLRFRDQKDKVSTLHVVESLYNGYRRYQ